MARREKLFAGGRLRAVRERLGQTQGVFAGRLGLSVSYLSQIETDRRPITMDLLLALNREFGIDLAGFALVAIDEQLNLRLESRKIPVDMVIVDRAEKMPSDN